jgi:hypothetical protein
MCWRKMARGKTKFLRVNPTTINHHYRCRNWREVRPGERTINHMYTEGIYDPKGPTILLSLGMVETQLTSSKDYQ